MFTFILFSWISKSVLGSCSLSNKELGYYGKVEDLHLSYSVDDIIEQYVKKMSLEKLVNMFEFCNCKKNDVSVFCINIFKTYYSTDINSNKEETRTGAWKRKALGSTRVEPIKLVEDSKAALFSVCRFQVQLHFIFFIIYYLEFYSRSF